MKILQHLSLSVLLCLNFSLFAQDDPKDAEQLSAIYSDYFSLNREAVHLHLNKTLVAPGEDLWFTAYVYSPMFSEPNLTTNLYVNLYNNKGILLEAKTVDTDNGQGQGHFALATYAPGTYLIKAGTKYMENFSEDSQYTQIFQIVGASDVPVVAREYDLQLLPEGGHLVANVENSVGVKLIDNSGKGISFSQGKILDSQEQVVTTFKSNSFGLSKFRFLPETGKEYSVVIEFEEGESLRKQVPTPEARGIVLSSTSLKDQLLFTLRTNEETFPSLKDKIFLFTFHKDGAMTALNIVFSESDKSANLTLKEDALYPGMNTITVFNEQMEPVLERLIFNHDRLPREGISASLKAKEADSLVLSLSSPEELGFHSLSVSVLPAESISYSPKNTVTSAFFIEPYIQGDLEDGGYYFDENIDLRRRDYDLDLLLLTQGWSRYSWKDIFKNPPKELHQHEHGFTLRGSVTKRNPKKHKNLFVGSTTDPLSLIAEISEDGGFNAENLFLQDSAKVTFSLLNDKNNRMTAPEVVANVFPLKNTENLSASEIIQMERWENPELKEKTELKPLPNDFILEGERLGTVFLESEVLTAEDKRIQEERKLNKMEMFGKYDLITEYEAKSNLTLFSILAEKGFEVRGPHAYTRRELMRKPLEVSQNFVIPARPAVIVIDGMESDVSELRTMRTSDVEYIYTNITGTGIRGSFYNGAGGGYIEVKLNEGRSKKSSTQVSTSILSNGFAPPKEFYTPKYNSYKGQAFQNYGTIGWFPEVMLEAGNLDLKILNTQQPVKLFIEGMTEEGVLISEEIEIDPEDKS